MSTQAMTTTNREFTHLVKHFQDALNSDEALREVLAAVCGGEQQLQLFLHPAGLGFTSFAKLVRLPPTTVRHYQRLGLITPYVVSRRFRFWFHNFIQAESVKQWRALGLSLDDIRAQRSSGRLGGQSATFHLPILNQQPLHSPLPVSVLVTDKTVRFNLLDLPTVKAGLPALNPASAFLPSQLHLNLLEYAPLKPSPAPLASLPPLETVAWSGLQPLLTEVTAARTRLEEQLRHLTQQVYQAQKLEATLQQAFLKSFPEHH